MQTGTNTIEIKNKKEILETPLFLHWFGVYSHCNKPLKRPRQEDGCMYPDFDSDIADSIEHYEKLKKSVIFPDFYLDDQIGIVSLLRNDNLNITLTVLNLGSERFVEFVGLQNLGDLLFNYPKLKKYLTENVNTKLSAMHYHPFFLLTQV